MKIQQILAYRTTTWKKRRPSSATRSPLLLLTTRNTRPTTSDSLICFENAPAPQTSLPSTSMNFSQIRPTSRIGLLCSWRNRAWTGYSKRDTTRSSVIHGLCVASAYSQTEKCPRSYGAFPLNCSGQGDNSIARGAGWTPAVPCRSECWYVDLLPF